MSPEELIECLAVRPFVPLRIHMSNGRSHDIRHSELAIVSQNLVAIGVQFEDDEIPSRIRLVDVHHINEVEPIPRPSDRGDSETG